MGFVYIIVELAQVKEPMDISNRDLKVAGSELHTNRLVRTERMRLKTLKLLKTLKRAYVGNELSPRQ
jgi:hypothetical protein